MSNGDVQLIIQRLDRVEGGLTELRTDVAELKTDVAELKTDVAELKTDVAELKGGQAKLKTELSDVREKVIENGYRRDELLNEVRAAVRHELRTGIREEIQTALSGAMIVNAQLVLSRTV